MYLTLIFSGLQLPSHSWYIGFLWGCFWLLIIPHDGIISCITFLGTPPSLICIVAWPWHILVLPQATEPVCQAEWLAEHEFCSSFMGTHSRNMATHMPYSDQFVDRDKYYLLCGSNSPRYRARDLIFFYWIISPENARDLLYAKQALYVWAMVIPHICTKRHLPHAFLPCLDCPLCQPTGGRMAGAVSKCMCWIPLCTLKSEGGP